MAPEWIIAAVSTSCGVLLVVGALVVGRATAELAFRKKRAELHAATESLRSRLQESLAKADAARAEVEAVRLERDEKVSQARGEQMAKSSQDDAVVDQLREKIAQLELKLRKAESATDEADKEFSIVREKLDQTEKRLAEANRLLAEDREPKDTATYEKLAALEHELQEAKRAAGRLPTIERERDQALKRIRELDKEATVAARVPTLESKLRSAESAIAKLESELAQRQQAPAPSADAGELERIRAELDAANERLAVSERVMEGVRARSNMLSQEVKRLKAELAGKN